ncbi:hypothetical protein HUG17_3156 [Dermatophagoides farinae]|nr:hypothetical protein HUG17_3156 [Dermatophagoides farinae]
MTIGKMGRKFPANIDEVRSYCRETTEMTRYVEKVTNECFSIENGNIAKLFIFGLKRMTRQMCSKRKNRRLTLMLANAACHNRIVSNDKCLAIVTNQTKNLIPLNIGKDKINFMCCYYVEMLRCEERFYSQLPCSQQEGRNAWIDLIRSMNEDSLNFACGDYNEQTDRCDTINEPDFNRRNASIKIDKRFNSFMIAALELFDSLA